MKIPVVIICGLALMWVAYGAQQEQNKPQKKKQAQTVQHAPRPTRHSTKTQKATAHSAEQNAALERVRKQQKEGLRQKAEATKKKNKAAGEQLSASIARQGQREKIQQLQARYNELQQQEDDLRRQIAKIGTTGRSGSSNKSAQADLAAIMAHEKAINREKDELRRAMRELSAFLARH